MPLSRFLVPAALVALLGALPAQAADEMTGHYKLSLTGPSKVAAGGGGALVLRITADKGYEVHQEPPAKVTLTAGPALALAKATLNNKDLKIVPDGATFDVPFTAQAKGKAVVDAAIRFYLCTDKACSPTEGKVSAQVAVQ